MIGALMPPWWKLAAAAMLLLVLAGGVWKVKHSGIVQGRAEVQAKWDAEKTALVELAHRTRDNQTQANQKVDNDYQTQKARIAADKRVTDERLREYQAAAADSSTAAASSGADDPYRAIADQCTRSIAILDGYAKGVAGKATALQDYARAMRLD